MFAPSVCLSAQRSHGQSPDPPPSLRTIDPIREQVVSRPHRPVPHAATYSPAYTVTSRDPPVVAGLCLHSFLPLQPFLSVSRTCASFDLPLFPQALAACDDMASLVTALYRSSWDPANKIISPGGQDGSISHVVSQPTLYTPTVQVSLPRNKSTGNIAQQTSASAVAAEKARHRLSFDEGSAFDLDKMTRYVCAADSPGSGRKCSPHKRQYAGHL